MYHVRIGLICVGTLRPRQNGHHVTYDVFNCISLNETFWTLNEISLKYVSYGLIDNMSALAQIMAWRRAADGQITDASLGLNDLTYRIICNISLTISSKFKQFITMRDRIMTPVPLFPSLPIPFPWRNHEAGMVCVWRSVSISSEMVLTSAKPRIKAKHMMSCRSMILD